MNIGYLAFFSETVGIQMPSDKVLDLLKHHPQLLSLRRQVCRPGERFSIPLEPLAVFGDAPRSSNKTMAGGRSGGGGAEKRALWHGTFCFVSSIPGFRLPIEPMGFAWFCQVCGPLHSKKTVNREHACSMFRDLKKPLEFEENKAGCSGQDLKNSTKQPNSKKKYI